MIPNNSHAVQAVQADPRMRDFLHLDLPFTSAMEVSALLKNFGYDLTITQLEPGPLIGSISVTVNGGNIYFKILNNLPLLWHGSRLQGFTPVAIEETGNPAQKAHGQRLAPYLVAGFFNQLTDTHFVTAGNARSLIALVPTRPLLNTLIGFGAENAVDVIHTANHIVINPETYRRLGLGIKRRAVAPEPDPTGANTEAFNALVAESFMARTERVKAMQISTQDAMVKEFVHLAAQKLEGEPAGLPELLDELHVGKTALSAAVKKAFSVSPMELMRRMRLEQVRHALVDEGVRYKLGKHKIEDIACHYGFRSRPHFAKNYSDLFGELPSETAGQLRLSA